MTAVGGSLKSIQPGVTQQFLFHTMKIDWERLQDRALSIRKATRAHRSEGSQSSVLRGDAPWLPTSPVPTYEGDACQSSDLSSFVVRQRQRPAAFTSNRCIVQGQVLHGLTPCIVASWRCCAQDEILRPMVRKLGRHLWLPLSTESEVENVWHQPPHSVTKYTPERRYRAADRESDA